MTQKIDMLVVEDDPYIRSLLTMMLKEEGYHITEALTGKEALSLFYANRPQIVLLDLGLPDVDGLEIIRLIRSKAQTPIVVISARDEETDIVKALDDGADDYITKPFYPGELLARLRVVVRKQKSTHADDKENSRYVFGDMVVDFDKGLVFRNNEEIHLTPIEYKLLTLFIQNRGKVLTHRAIIRSVWEHENTKDAQKLRVFMAGLRRKIEHDTQNPQYILTQTGIGYRFLGP